MRKAIDGELAILRVVRERRALTFGFRLSFPGLAGAAGRVSSTDEEPVGGVGDFGRLLFPVGGTLAELPEAAVTVTSSSPVPEAYPESEGVVLFSEAEPR